MLATEQKGIGMMYPLRKRLTPSVCFKGSLKWHTLLEWRNIVLHVAARRV